MTWPVEQPDQDREVAHLLRDREACRAWRRAGVGQGINGACNRDQHQAGSKKGRHFLPTGPQPLQI